MLGKLIIIGIIIVALIILVPNISKIFGPNTIDSIKDRIDKATSDSGINSTTVKSAVTNEVKGKLVDMLNSSSKSVTTPMSIYNLPAQYVDRQNYTGQVFDKVGNTCKISVPGLSSTINGQKELTHIIDLDKCSMNIGEPVQVSTLTVKPDAPVANLTNAIQVSTYADSGSSNSALSLPAYYKVVRLDATSQGNNISINYDDSSGSTRSVTVSMKNNEKILFSGTFYSSKFTTDVKDIPDTPHIIEMTIDNTVYGTLHASVYAPSNMKNSTISGIFTN